MNGLRILVALAAILSVGCVHPIRGFRVGAGMLDTTHHLIGHVCEKAETVIDNAGIVWGVRFVAAALGQPCSVGGREINVPAALENELRKALELQVGQAIEIDGDLAQRDLSTSHMTTLTATAGPRAFNEPIYARSIRLRQRSN